MRRFQETFSLPDIRYSKMIGGYHLMFLPIDDLSSNLISEMSEKTLAWFQAELRNNPQAPTIVFYHAPLKGTLKSDNKYPETDNCIAQPADKIHQIIMENPQLLLWVSGHIHIAPSNRKFNHRDNIYGTRVTNIDDLVKSRQSDGCVKSSRCQARKT